MGWGSCVTWPCMRCRNATSARGVAASAQAYAMLFGVVTGMMVFISFSELLPTALRYDPERKYYFQSFIAGMVVMAASLMLFVAA